MSLCGLYTSGCDRAAISENLPPLDLYEGAVLLLHDLDLCSNRGLVKPDPVWSY